MGTEVVQFINRWLYDVDRFLRNRLESLKDDLVNDDPAVQECASNEAEMILDWLSIPEKPLTMLERYERANRALQQNDLTDDAKEAAITQAMRSTGRRVGRPRDTASLAIRALGLHLAGFSWREITMKLKGCRHTLPIPPTQDARKRNSNLSCLECAESVRLAVVRLKKFLKLLGFDFDVPKIKKTDTEMRSQLLKSWGVER